ncbi:SIR2 family protein [Mesorhizobium sp. M7A.F.Ca.ET.027.03.2.1]|uniref:protein kinase domain-containing protein n=1 Tax=Mesorhizobium sp. M7A.F.Ca.ET.027.03.2.1 TaxID=2496656 RepID=UPI000FCB3A6A|nr:SIR2 family protein [Mesorhizobium sp. M7A.F.Ca.ET.027.03.2.1]RVD63822.1 hypothetical protein EN750_15510 [Mesorhizobium sp. M7A.F.Ca.ET.027.03.2.1]
MSFNEIFKQPAYTLLRKAISEHIAPLTLVIGSGASKPAGLPDWQGLRRLIQLHLDNLRDAKWDEDPKFDDIKFRVAKASDDYWSFFDAARELLTPATFNGIVRNALDIPHDISSTTYERLFELNPRGVVTLNLDRLTGEAFSKSNQGEYILPIYGFDLSKKWHVITDERPFLVYIHGHVSDSDTWVLTKHQLNQLRATKAHELFLSYLYLNYTVIFYGISVDDLAISERLVSLKESGFEAPRLFWLTNRKDQQASKWASDNNVQRIFYTANKDSDHSSVVNAIVNDINSFKSHDVEIEPTSPARIFDTELRNSEDPRSIANKNPEDVRKILSNLLAEEIGSSNGSDVYDIFERFSEKYDFAIQTRSFYRAKGESDRYFFGYKLHFPELGKGNFGSVYLAETKDGDFFALKIMHSHILQAREMLGGFRRGVNSMKILTMNKVAGVVPLIEAFEMPPTLVMSHVAGNSLEELFSEISRYSWRFKLKIISGVASIVDSCHKLPEMVLHRDIKPSNIMLEGLDFESMDYSNVFVLDFDMSWHKGSSEKDVVFESRDDFGYLAPEQTSSSMVSSARSTKVDSFGLGITTYALFGGQHPIPGQYMSEAWMNKIRAATRSRYDGNWKCFPERLARAIFGATTFEQERRLDFSSLKSRLEKVNSTILSSKEVAIDIIAEEILCRIADGREYLWDDILDKGKVGFVDGFSVTISSNIGDRTVTIEIDYLDKGSKAHKKRNELLGQCKEDLDMFCRDRGYNVSRINLNHGLLGFTLTIHNCSSVKGCLEVSRGIFSAISPSLNIY